jgi:hypothetical protein
MQRLRIERPTQNHVMAALEDSALSFELPPAATLEDLADRLAFLGVDTSRAPCEQDAEPSNGSALLPTKSRRSRVDDNVSSPTPNGSRRDGMTGNVATAGPPGNS